MVKNYSLRNSAPHLGLQYMNFSMSIMSTVQVTNQVFFVSGMPLKAYAYLCGGMGKPFPLFACTSITSNATVFLSMVKNPGSRVARWCSG